MRRLTMVPPDSGGDGRIRQVLIVDDHPPIRDWVRATLAPYRIAVQEARSGEAAIALVAQGTRVDGAICDVLMPHAEIEGIAAARTLWHEYGIPCLMLTASDAARTRLAAIYAGAVGYVLKDAADADTLARSVLAMLDGRRLDALWATVTLSDAEARQVAETQAAYRRALEHLTPQQRVVAGLILEGKTNHEIAERLVLSRGTVNSHVSSILQRLNLATRRAVKTRVLLTIPGTRPQEHPAHGRERLIRPDSRPDRHP